jgi:hypothetical protein
MNKNILSNIEFYYWRNQFKNVIAEINNIHHTTDKVLSSFPTIPITIYYTVLYIPNVKLIQYGLSERIDKIRAENDISFINSCADCDLNNGVRICNYTTCDGTITLPIFRYGGACKNCIGKLKKINKNYKLY